MKRKKLLMKVGGLITALLLVLLLTGCGFASANNASSISDSTPTVLHVTRNGPNTTALDRTSTDAQLVQQLYSAAHALPVVSSGTSVCAAHEIGTVYYLSFLHEQVMLQQMEMHPGACAWLYLSNTDARQLTSAFLSLLAKAIGEPPGGNWSAPRIS